MNFEEKYKLFLNKNYDEFVKLYITERLRLGEGCLFGNLINNDKVDLYYLGLDNIPAEIRNDLKKKIDSNTTSQNKLYCYFYDECNSLLFELEFVNNI